MSISLSQRLKSVNLIFACGTALFSDGSYVTPTVSLEMSILVRSSGAPIPQIIDTPILSVLTRVYGSDALAAHDYSRTLTSVGFAGTVVGMLTFGYISEKLDESLAWCSPYFPGSLRPLLAPMEYRGLLSMLSAMRFLLGIGVGAEYPCGSVSASEQSEEPGISKNAQHRWFALATNSMIDFGFVISAFVPLVLFWMFLYDFIVYPFGIYSSTILNKFQLTLTLSVTGGTDNLAVILGWNVVINLFYMPGTLGGAFIVDYLGPKWTMITGLLLQAVIGFIMSGLYAQLTNHIAAFAVVYGIFLSFGELGPGNCLGLLASKSSPTAVRGQFYGIAAAIGKVGAFVGTWAFGGSESLRGNTGPFWIGSGLAILSALITLFFIKPLSHDGMEQEDRLFREYLEQNGYDTSAMGLPSAETTRSDSLDEEKEKVPV
ncbi:major facilitator superfamily domain-containing protein [Infundibulicybe gibba]|nr:major facilitator superfamily domain-containing protein [Infundibulicybe gibba]